MNKYLKILPAITMALLTSSIVAAQSNTIEELPTIGYETVAQESKRMSGYSVVVRDRHNQRKRLETIEVQSAMMRLHEGVVIKRGSSERYGNKDAVGVVVVIDVPNQLGDHELKDCTQLLDDATSKTKKPSSEEKIGINACDHLVQKGVQLREHYDKHNDITTNALCSSYEKVFNNPKNKLVYNNTRFTVAEPVCPPEYGIDEAMFVYPIVIK